LRYTTGVGSDADSPSTATRVIVLGATGSIGRATVAALLGKGYAVTAVVRPGSTVRFPHAVGAVVREADVTDPVSLSRDGFGGERFDVWVSCLASRTGEPADAWAIDHRAHSQALAIARDHGVAHVVVVSAICVQRPRLAFQHAKLAFEAELQASGISFSIVRPTAFFKSLSGQVKRVQAGKPFLAFGDGRLTACRPISDADLADFVVGCIDDPARHRRILPIGGPGPPLTPLDQAAMLERLAGRPVRIRHVPVALLDVIVGVLSAASIVWPSVGKKAELAKIGRYYATESMLVWDAARGAFDATATPQTGHDTLEAHYAAMWRGDAVDERRDHAVLPP
jgi:divinyl chlorophyllide a 8-vinyl-reductase